MDMTKTQQFICDFIRGGFYGALTIFLWKWL